MRLAMRKPCKTLFKSFAACITELNNYLPLFPSLSSSKKMPPEEMEVAEKFYKGGTTSKTLSKEDSNRASHGRKQNRGESALPTNPKKGRAGKRKAKMQAIQVIGRPYGKSIYTYK